GRRRGAWVPLAAGLALLGMLGSDPHADLGAHLWGFLVGIGLGAGTALAFVTPPGRATQLALGIMATAMVAGCWWLALRAWSGPAAQTPGSALRGTRWSPTSMPRSRYFSSVRSVTRPSRMRFGITVCM